MLYEIFGYLFFDALGALAAALLMAVASLVLMTQTRALITGRALPRGMLKRLRDTVRATPGVDAVNQLTAVYAGVSAVLVEADLDLAEDLDTLQIEALLDVIEARLRSVLPHTERVRVILNSPAPERRSVGTHHAWPPQDG